MAPKGRKSNRPFVRTPHSTEYYRFFAYTYVDQSDNSNEHGYIQVKDETGVRRNVAGHRLKSNSIFIANPYGANAYLIDPDLTKPIFEVTNPEPYKVEKLGPPRTSEAAERLQSLLDPPPT